MQPHASMCISLQNLEYEWGNGVQVLSVRALNVEQGERVFLRGPSGSGKSTLLGIIAGVFQPTSGEATILGHPFHKISATERDRRRADSMGVIFQQFNLVPYLSLVENVLLPCRFSSARAEKIGATQTQQKNKAIALLDRLGLDDEARSNRPAAELSVGQQQRVAAARALIGAPSLVIADEPTSALDSDLRNTFIETLLGEANNATVLFISHDASLSRHFDRVISMEDINFTKPVQGAA